MQKGYKPTVLICGKDISIFLNMLIEIKLALSQLSSDPNQEYFIFLITVLDKGISLNMRSIMSLYEYMHTLHPYSIQLFVKYDWAGVEPVQMIKKVHSLSCEHV